MGNDVLGKPCGTLHDTFIASILNEFPGAKIFPPPLSPTRGGNNRHGLDSWENYMERPAIWIDPDPLLAPTPGAVV